MLQPLPLPTFPDLPTMLVVIILIAILGTNLLLGFFVANTLGYGPQTFNELLTGIYKAPIGWTLKQMTAGTLSPEKRRQWAAEIAAYCSSPPGAEPVEAIGAQPDVTVDDDESFADEDDEDSMQQVSIESAAGNGSSAEVEHPDWAVLQRVLQFAQISPVMLDELRFQWQYNEDLPGDDQDDPASAEASQPVDEESSFGEPGDEDLSDDEDEEGDAEDRDASAGEEETDVAAALWSRDQLLDQLQQWDEFLETYEPVEVSWWLEWHGYWEKYVGRWREHCREISAVGLVERLLHENREEEVPQEEAPKSVRSTKQAKEQPAPVAKPEPVDPKKRWVQGQYGRLLQSLFDSSAKLRQAERQLVEFTEASARKQWKPEQLKAQAPTPSYSSVFGLRTTLESVQPAGDAQPNFAIILLPDHLNLLELDCGKLIASAGECTVARHMAEWCAADKLPGIWCRSRYGALVGLLNGDEATVRQKASWILINLRHTRLKTGDFQLKQTCNLVVVALKPEDLAGQVEAAFRTLQRRNIQRRMACGNLIWELKGRRLSMLAIEESEFQESDLLLGIQGSGIDVNAVGLLDDLGGGDDSEDDDDDADW